MASKWLWCIFQLPVMSGLRLVSGIRCRPCKASSPGRSPCSISSSEAPPPVEMWSISVGQAELGDGRGAVAAADHGEPTAVGHRLGHGAGAGLEAGVLEHAHRARSRRSVRASAMTSENSAAVPGPMSRPIHPSGTEVPSWRTSPPADGSPILPPGPRPVMSDGRWIGVPAPSSFRQVSTWSGSSSEAPMPLPWAARKVKHMPPPMTSPSTMPSSALMTPSLSLTLAPAEDGDEGPLRLVADARAGPRPPRPAAGRRRWEASGAGRRSRRGPGARRRTRR